MTPAIGTPALPPAATPASGRGPAAAPDGGGGSNAFAKALQRRQTVDAAQAGPKSASVETPAASDPALDAAAAAGAAAPVVATAEPAEPALVDVQQALPGWPPAGLAGLLGFADDAAPLETPPAPTPVPVSISVPGPVSAPGQPPAGLSAAPPPAAAVAAAAAAPAPALPDTALPEPAALPAAGPIDQPGAVDGAEPSPVAFVLPAPAALREPPPLLAAPLPTPHVGAEDFEARFGAQIEWMADRRITEARIRVTPNDLGPVEVRLHMDGDRIRADFVSGNAETRQALEHGLPRLRDLLGEHGFQLAHAGVGSGRSGGDGAPSPAQRKGDGPHDAAPGPIEGDMPRRRQSGLLDAYA